MSTRTDISTQFHTSPRIVEVKQPSTRFAAQDIVDTLRKEEDSSRGMSETKLMNASGKENLGGGVKVGITVELQDAKIAFEGRTVAAQTGVVTVASGVPISELISLVDDSATFISNGVQRGSLVINYTDRSITEVFSVGSETQLSTKVLVNGLSNAFNISDSYDIFNIVQCEVLGGNVVAVDSSLAELPAILPTAFTQVVKVSASSATQTEQSAIRFASYQGAAWVDETGGVAGTSFPIGTREFPTKTLKDAVNIANTVGLNTIGLVGNLNIGATDVVSNFTIEGRNTLNSAVVVASTANVNDTEIVACFVTGSVNGNVVLRDSVIGDLVFSSGFMFQCAFSTASTIVLSGGFTPNFLNCFSGTPGPSIATVDMNGSGSGLAMKQFNGSILITNKSGPEPVTIDLASGEVILSATVLNGTITVRGDGKLVDVNGVSIPSGVWNGVVIIENETSRDPKFTGDSVWGYLTTDATAVGTIGEHILKKLLSFKQFIGLK